MGDKVNGRFVNGMATAYLVLLLAVSVITIPLLVATRAGA
jgi:hypothetical protein